MENTCFRDPIWLQQNILNDESVLEYFSCSQFYDKNCNNEILKMQMITIPTEVQKYLKKMCGIQYVLEYSNEFLFVIKKYKRISPEKLQVLNFYYIMHGTVYQAPTEQEVSKTRYTNILFSMLDSLKDIPFLKTQNNTVLYSDKKKSRSVSRVTGLFNTYYTDFIRK